MAQDPLGPQEFMNTTQVAQYLNLHEITVYKLIKQGKIPAFKIGGRWRFKKKILDDWITMKMKGTRSKRMGSHSENG